MKVLSKARIAHELSSFSMQQQNIYWIIIKLLKNIYVIFGYENYTFGKLKSLKANIDVRTKHEYILINLKSKKRLSMLSKLKKLIYVKGPYLNLGIVVFVYL